MVTHIPGLLVVVRSDIVPWQVITTRRNGRLVPRTHSLLSIVDGCSRVSSVPILYQNLACPPRYPLRKGKYCRCRAEPGVFLTCVCYTNDASTTSRRRQCESAQVQLETAARLSLYEERVGHAKCFGSRLNDTPRRRWMTDKMRDPYPSCQTLEVSGQYYQSLSARRRRIFPRSDQGDLTTSDIKIVQ